MMRYLLRFVDRYSRRITHALIMVVFFLSATLTLISGDKLRYPDERDYNMLAQSICSGEGYVNAAGENTAYRPPGWPFVISSVYRVFSAPVVAKLLNAMALAGTALMLSILVARITPMGRFIAPLLMLLYPIVFYTSTTLYPQTFGTFLFVAILFLLSSDMHVALRYGLSGLLLGFLVLSIPSFMLVAPLIVAGVFLAYRPPMKNLVRQMALFVLCTVMVVMPWTIRNAYIFHKFVPVSTNSGVNLLLGNSENTKPNNGVNVDISHYTEATKGLSEVEKDVKLRGFALDWCYNNPMAATTLYFQKVLNYFHFRNELHVTSEQSSLRNYIMFISYYPLLLIVLIRLFICKKSPLSSVEYMLYIIYFGNAFFSSIFFTRIRFRIPFDVILMGIVAIALGKVAEAIHSSINDNSLSTQRFDESRKESCG